MIRSLVPWLGIVLLATSPAMSGYAAARQFEPAAAATSPRVMYISGGHLWVRPVDGGDARPIATPWSMGTRPGNVLGAQWSPDESRVALDDGRSRLAVIRLADNHVTMVLPTRRDLSWEGLTYQWSPNGRYLAFVKPIAKGDVSSLAVWDSVRGTKRTILGRVSEFGGFSWSHSSARLVVATGEFDSAKSVFPWATVVDLAGHAHTLGKGTQSEWSPDDRLIASIRPNMCGANTCDENEVIQPSAGGKAIVLKRHADSNFDNPIWAPRPNGYGFDRWLLTLSGHPRRSLAGRNERVDSWEPSGSHLALQTYYPYQTTPDALYVATPGGSRVHLYTDGENAGCGACSKDVYRVTWSRQGGLIAFATPTYPTPKMVTVYPKVYVSSTTGRPLTRIAVPGTDAVDILGFVDNDQALVIASGTRVYRYDIPTHRVTIVASGVLNGAGSPALGPMSIQPATP